MQNVHDLYERIEALERRVDSAVKDAIREVIRQELQPIKETLDDHTARLTSIETTLAIHSKKLDHIVKAIDEDWLTGGKVGDYTPIAMARR